MYKCCQICLPPPQGCRSVEEFQCLNRIEEGTYGVVYRAKDKKTGRLSIKGQGLVSRKLWPTLGHGVNLELVAQGQSWEF